MRKLNGGELFVGILAMPILIVLRGWEIAMLWHWFVAPLFNLPELRLIQAAGISMIVTALVQPPSREEEFVDALGRSLVGPPIAVLFGWLLHFFL